MLSRPNPSYPLAAKQARVQGTVVVLAVVAPDGRVKSAKAISGPPLLFNAAVAAVQDSVYQPAMLNGSPVESETRVELKFSLTK